MAIFFWSIFGDRAIFPAPFVGLEVRVLGQKVGQHMPPGERIVRTSPVVWSKMAQKGSFIRKTTLLYVVYNEGGGFRGLGISGLKTGSEKEILI